MNLSFSVPIRPKAKARPRFANGHAYTPKSTKDYENTIAKYAEKAGAKPLPNPVVIDITATFKSPKRMKSFEYCTKPPDVDNLLKMMDALNGVAWLDDKQIVSATISKNYGDEDRMDFNIEYLT